MLNKTFGNLTVISDQIKIHNGKRNRVYRDCKCICGTETRVREDNLKSGNTENCGCMLKIPSTLQNNLTKRITLLENGIKKAMKRLEVGHGTVNDPRKMSMDELLDLYCDLEKLIKG